MKKITTKNQQNFFWLLVLLILQSGSFFIWTLLIPADSKHAFFLGFSKNRWIIYLSFLGLIAIISSGLFDFRHIYNLLGDWFNSPNHHRIVRWITLCITFFLWITVWLPITRFHLLEEEILRLRPFMLAGELALLDIILFFKIHIIKEYFTHLILVIGKNPRKIIVFFSLIFVVAFIFAFLRFLSPAIITENLLFAPGPAITPFQILFALLIFLIIFFITQQEKISKSYESTRMVILFFAIWGFVFILWSITPFGCDGDRPGPFPPNDVCYPQVTDAVYSIGSHYITLGGGIYNHWFTEKPFYMVFLAIGEWLAGPQIDHYLIFQIGVLSFIPALLFLLGTKLLNFSSGILLATLSGTLGMDAILSYQQAGSVNVNIENSELLTGFLLILVTIGVFQYFQNQENKRWLILSGGALGLASLTRINPLFVLPTILLLLFGIFWHKKRHMIISILLFLFAFCIIFFPGILSVRDKDGNSYYIQKIDTVINHRYLTPKDSVKSVSTMKVDNEINFFPIPEYYGKTLVTESITINEMGKAVESGKSEVKPFFLILPPSLNTLSLQKIDQEKNPTDNLIIRIIYHFLNNLYMSLAKLPVNLSLHSMNVILSQPLWLDNQGVLIWDHQLSMENLFALCLNFFIILIGVTAAFSRWRLVGLSPLFIFFAYHLGNAFALTSGGRYLEPVIWVIFLYFAAGIFSITQLFFLIPRRTNLAPLKENKSQVMIASRENRVSRFNLVGCWIILFIIASFIPLVSIIPNRIQSIPLTELDGYISEFLTKQNLFSQSDIEILVTSPNVIIVEGIAYHPRYYDSPLFTKDQELFELTILGKENVYISNLFGKEPENYFSDGSRVILVGCKIRDKNFWGAETVIMRTLAILQLDHQGEIFINKNFNMVCH